MHEKRKHQRISCYSKCLVYYEQARYQGVILNISLSGAALKLYGLKAGVMKPGDRCSLILCADPTICFYRYAGRVARVSSSAIGLEFLDSAV